MFRSPPVDLIVVLIIVLLIMGPKRLPQMGRGLGQGMREFKDGITGQSKDEDEEKAALSEARANPDPASAPQQPAAVRGSGSAGSDRPA